jgi:hypothetical protein
MPTPRSNDPQDHQTKPAAHARDAEARSRQQQGRNSGRSSKEPRPLSKAPESACERKTAFSIIVALSEPRGREIIYFFGEPGDDLMAAALSLEERGIKCRRILLLLDDHELRTLAAGWLPLKTRLSGLSRADLITLLTEAAGD